MKKLLLLLAVLSFAGQAQIQFLRGDSTSRPTLSIGQPALDTNIRVGANTLWIGTANGNRPMGGDGIRWGNLVYGSCVSSNDSFTVTIPHGPYVYTNGMTLRFLSDSTNDGASYVNVNGKGWKQITKFGSTALAASDIGIGAVVSVTYDGTQFQMPSPDAALPKKYAGVLSQDGNTVTASVYVNTLGGSVVWAKSATGYYIGTLASAFTANKTVIDSHGTGGPGTGEITTYLPLVLGTFGDTLAIVGYYTVFRLSVNAIAVYVVNTSFAPSDLDGLGATQTAGFNVSVYP